MANLTFEGIGKVYSDRVRAISNFNLEINHNEFIIIIGPSGCGKSTLLRMIAGLEEISEGILRIDNKIVNDLEPKDRDIAMVFQNYALYPHMSVYENMAFGLKIRKTPKKEIEERVHNAAQTLGIQELLKRKPKELSGGQKQRVALGRAIVRNPKVFLMDEPLSNLDAKLRVQTRAEIVKLHKKLRTTFIYVTHDQTEAMTMGDKIVVMKEGVIQQFGSPKELYECPVNLFVAGFIGTPQMNFIEAEVYKADQALFLKINEWKLELNGVTAKSLAEKNFVGRTIVIGIRPENVIVGNKNETAQITGVIDMIENMGSDKYLYITIGSDRVVARVGADFTAKHGDSLPILINAHKTHYFDKETEERIEIEG